VHAGGDDLIFNAHKWTGAEAVAGGGTVIWDVSAGDLLLDVGGSDWSACRSLSLELEAERQTGARVELTLEGTAADGTDSVLGAVTFAIDWVGRNVMNLWLGNLSSSGQPEALRSVQRVRLRRLQQGLWPTVLRVGSLRVSAEAPVWPVNESDTVIDAAWHSVAARVQEWRVIEEGTRVPAGPVFSLSPQPMSAINKGQAEQKEGDDRARGRMRGPAAWCSFGYPQGDEAGRLCVERIFDMDVSGQREILAKLAWDKDLRVTVTAIVEGASRDRGGEAGASEIDLIAHGEPGREWLTVGASLNGARRLRAVRISASEVPGRRVDGRDMMVSLFWVLLRRDSVLDCQPVHDVAVRLVPAHAPYPAEVKTVTRHVRLVPFEEPPESHTPIGDPLSQGLPYGFLVRKDGLENLRRRCRDGTGARIFQAIREEADRAIATELVDRNNYGTAFGGGIGQLKGVRGAGMRVFGPLTALTHLITGEERYAIACRRWILRAALSDDWRGDHGGCVDRPQVGDRLPYWDSFTGWYPKGFAGYMNHPFMVADAAFGIVVAYDMLYHCFNDAEKEMVEQAFARHGIYVLADKLRQSRDFYVRMNQGILFALPLLMQTAFLKDRDPVYAHLHAWTLEFLEEFTAGPWNEEGVCGEGPGYGIGTLNELVEALPIIAACKGVSVEDVLPPVLPRVMTYLQHVRSTWDNDGGGKRPHFLGISDGSEHNWVGPAVLAFYARYLRDPVAQYYWNESYADRPLQSLPTLLSLGDEIRPEEPSLPPALVFRDQPMVFFRTGWRPGSALVCLNNIRQVTCHGHKDRGALILEYNGEQLILDPGMVGYSDPAGALYHETFCHSTITFSQQSQLGGTESYDTAILDFISTSGQRCPGEPAGIDWAIADLGAVYPQAVRVWRHVIFLRPDVCLLYDEVETADKEQIEINFTCLAEPAREPGTGAYIGRTARNGLLLWTISDCALTSKVSNWGTHWPQIPSYRLVWATKGRATSARFLSAIVAWEASAAQPRVTAITEPGLLGFEVCRGKLTESAVMSASRGVCWKDVSTDARAVVARGREGTVVGAAVLEGSHAVIGGRRLGCSAAVRPTGAERDPGPSAFSVHGDRLLKGWRL